MTTSTGFVRPRIGFLGVGWIGQHRLEAIAGTDLIEVTAIADPLSENLARATALAPHATTLASLDALLGHDLDGIVIATPSALHADQCVRALDRGIAVFCQKPLGRSSQEVRAVVEAARRADRLLGVDLSYRGTAGMHAVRERIRAGELGHVHAVDLTFHNAYGPDKPWFYDPALSGGGCVMDLGVHLLDLALWVLDFPDVESVAADLFSKGHPLADHTTQVEDYAIATLRLAGGTVVRLACSWHLPAGQDAIIAADFYGDRAGAAFRNVGGSFYDFEAALLRGTGRDVLTSGPDAWGGRMAANWALRLSQGSRFDEACDRLVDVAALIDGIYTAAQPEPTARPAIGP